MNEFFSLWPLVKSAIYLVIIVGQRILCDGKMKALMVYSYLCMFKKKNVFKNR